MTSSTRYNLLVLGAVFSLGACNRQADVATSDTAAGSAATPAATPAMSREPTAEELSRYPLDMEKLRKLAATMSSMSEAAKRGEKFTEKDATSESTAQTIARLDADPAMRTILRKVGWSAEEYVFTTAAWMQAAMMEGVLASTKGATLPTGHSPQNIEFLKAHKAEIEKMTAGLGGDGD